jgi:hypothetical protein
MTRYLAVSGSVCGLIALLHILRLVRGWPATVADYPVPLWISILAVLLFGGLAAWAFRLSKHFTGSSPPGRLTTA